MTIPPWHEEGNGGGTLFRNFVFHHGGQKTAVYAKLRRAKKGGRKRDERPTSNTRLPCITNDGGMNIATGPRHKGYSTKTTQRHCGQIEHPTSNEKQKKQRAEGEKV